MILRRYVIRVAVISKSNDSAVCGIWRNFYSLRKPQPISSVEKRRVKSILTPIGPSVLVRMPNSRVLIALFGQMENKHAINY